MICISTFLTISRISFFAYPFLGESKAITDISYIFKDPPAASEQLAPRQHMPLEFLVAMNEAQASQMTLVDSRTQLYIDIVGEATEIYRLRVNTPDSGSRTTSSAVTQSPQSREGPPLWPASDDEIRLASLRCLFEQVDCFAPGSHTIVWPAFVAAAESQSDDDRAFFVSILQSIWEWTRYANVLKGLDALPGIWAEQKLGRNWTSMLSTLKTVVM